jgi:nicotinate-nucleotide adenylyltransferase
MLRLAIAGNPAFHVSTLETDRGGVSFTAETLSTVAHQEPGAELYLLLGADSLQDLPTWRQPERICQLAVPVVVCRAGASPPDWNALSTLVSPERLQHIRSHQVQMPIIELSSTRIRQAVAAGHSIRYQTPRAVEAYIVEHRLYG